MINGVLGDDPLLKAVEPEVNLEDGSSGALVLPAVLHGSAQELHSPTLFSSSNCGMSKEGSAN
jgi:hypothetical protein